MLKVTWRRYDDENVNGKLVEENFKDAITKRCEQLLFSTKYENVENIKMTLENEIYNLKQMKDTLHKVNKRRKL